MLSRRYVLLGIGVVVAVALVIVITLAFTPQETNPAFDAAAAFWNAAGSGDDAKALPLLSADLQTWVQTNCPDGSVSACVKGYIPPEWGNLQKAVFRRSAPDGDKAWNVDVIATYEKDTGASGVCAFFRLEQEADGSWKIVRWAGFLWCGDNRSRNMATNPDTPNQAP